MSTYQPTAEQRCYEQISNTQQSTVLGGPGGAACANFADVRAERHAAPKQRKATLREGSGPITQRCKHSHHGFTAISTCLLDLHTFPASLPNRSAVSMFFGALSACFKHSGVKLWKLQQPTLKLQQTCCMKHLQLPQSRQPMRQSCRAKSRWRDPQRTSSNTARLERAPGSDCWSSAGGTLEASGP